MREKARLLRRLTLLTQLGLSLVAPPLLLLWLAVTAQRRWGFGFWVIPAALVVGLISSACGAYDFYRRTLRDKDKKRPPASFDHHE